MRAVLGVLCLGPLVGWYLLVVVMTRAVLSGHQNLSPQQL
jgi:hypothetical protein